MQGKLILEDGTVFAGEARGYKNSCAGEVVFATGMTGYDLTLTDPSFKGQILTFTYPLIGNWGAPRKEQWESDKIHLSGVIISDLTAKPNHWQMEKTLEDWLTQQKIPALVAVDTRALTQKLREKGVMLGKIIVGNSDIDFTDPNKRNLVAEVSTSEVKVYKPETSNQRPVARSGLGKLETGSSLKIGLLNCGAKKNIISCLTKRGAKVYELPWNYDPFDQPRGVAAQSGGKPQTGPLVTIPKLDGLVISNGPGDPKMAGETIAIIKKALGKQIPTFGICLGNQLLALAAGGDTYKLKFGHRAQNQPTIQVGNLPADRQANRCYITTQNHGYAVNENKLPKGFMPWFINANDNTNEGIVHEKLPFFSVQFHPESFPGPTDTEWLFDYFLDRVNSKRKIK